MFNQLESKINSIIKRNDSKELNECLKNNLIKADFVFTNGYSLLAKILYGKNKEMLQVLIDNNVDVNKSYQVVGKDNIYFPIMIPLIDDNVELFDMLLKNGTNFILNDGKYKEDVFDSAIIKNKKNILTYLIENKIRIDEPIIHRRESLTLKEYPAEGLIIKELRNQSLTQLAIKNGYVKNLSIPDIIDCLKFFVQKNNPGTVKALAEYLNSSDFDKKDENRYIAKEILTSTEAYGNEKSLIKVLEGLKEDLLKENFNDMNINHMLKKLNFIGLEFLHKTKKLDEKNLFYKGVDPLSRLMDVKPSTLPDIGEYQTEAKNKIVRMLINMGIDYKKEKKVYSYIEENMPDIIANDQKNELESILNKPNSNPANKKRL